MQNISMKGFTLLEIMIVVAIIGILAAAIMVNLNGSQQKSKKSAVIQSMKSFMPYAVQCSVGAAAVTAATTGNGNVNPPCAGAPNYPLLNTGSTSGCWYNGSTSALVNISCSGFTVTCNTSTGACQ